jgi:hypothetical protein
MEIKSCKSGDEPDWQWFEEGDIRALLSEVARGCQLIVKYENSSDIWYETYYLKHDGTAYRYSKVEGCFDVYTPVDHKSDIHNKAVSEEEATRLMESWARQGLVSALFEKR